MAAHVTRGWAHGPAWLPTGALVGGALLAALPLLAACDEGEAEPNDGDGQVGMPSDGGADGASPDGTSPDGQTVPPPTQDATPTACDASDPNVDADGDGFTPGEGDCNDCVAQINPGAYDVPGNAHDEDCDGTADTEPEECQDGLSLAPASADDAARALGLCHFTQEDGAAWGVIETRFAKVSGEGELGSPLQVGLLPDFGTVQPLEGSKLLALSSGVARAPGQDDYTAECDGFWVPPADPPDPTCGCDALDLLCQVNCIPDVNDGYGDPAPEGYPQRSSECGPEAPFQPGARIFDQAGFEVTLRVPTNARGLTFNSAFFTAEYPNFVCSSVNDFFVVFKTPRAAGATDDNILFDANGDSVGVDSGLLAVCDPGVQSPDAARQHECAQGPDFLQGTGFGPPDDNRCGGGQSGASTGWLQTTTAVTPGEKITLHFVVWDTGDSTLDSSVVVDNFQWVVDEVDGDAPVDVETETVPVLF